MSISININFDTFEEFANFHENDISNVVWEKGDYKCTNSYEKLTEIINIHNDYYYTPSNIKLIAGDVNENVPPFLENNKHIIISLLYLDMDVYEPTKNSIKIFFTKNG